jgi:hypothetical protein
MRGNNAVGRHVLGDDRTCRHDRAVTDRHAFEDDGSGADPDIITAFDLSYLIV